MALSREARVRLLLATVALLAFAVLLAGAASAASAATGEGRSGDPVRGLLGGVASTVNGVTGAEVLPAPAQPAPEDEAAPPSEGPTSQSAAPAAAGSSQPSSSGAGETQRFSPRSPSPETHGVLVPSRVAHPPSERVTALPSHTLDRAKTSVPVVPEALHTLTSSRAGGAVTRTVGTVLQRTADQPVRGGVLGGVERIAQHTPLAPLIDDASSIAGELPVIETLGPTPTVPVLEELAPLIQRSSLTPSSPVALADAPIVQALAPGGPASPAALEAKPRVALLGHTGATPAAGSPPLAGATGYARERIARETGSYAASSFSSSSSSSSPPPPRRRPGRPRREVCPPRRWARRQPAWGWGWRCSGSWPWWRRVSARACAHGGRSISQRLSS